MTKIRSSQLIVAASLVALSAPVANAQSLQLRPDAIELFDTDGDSAIRIDDSADYVAGGDGRSATLNLRSTDGLSVLFYQSFQAELFLGELSREGILLLRDNDGTTTTLELDGRFGAVFLGGAGEDGDVVVADDSGNTTIRLNGDPADLTNAIEGNGLLKAWAKVSSGGAIVSCYRCDPGQSFSPEFAEYQVDFGPLAVADIRSRPRTAILDSHVDTFLETGGISLSDSATSNTAIYVRTYNTMGNPTDKGFTLFVY